MFQPLRLEFGAMARVARAAISARGLSRRVIVGPKRGDFTMKHGVFAMILIYIHM